MVFVGIAICMRNETAFELKLIGVAIILDLIEGVRGN